MSLLFRYPIKNLSWRKAYEKLESAKQILSNKNPTGIYQLSRLFNCDLCGNKFQFKGSQKGKNLYYI